MGILDEMGDALGRSIDTTASSYAYTGNVERAQYDLAQVESQRMAIYAQIGQQVIAEQGSDEAFRAKYSLQMATLEQLARRSTEINQYITNANLAALPPFGCPFCGNPVRFNNAFCPSCGKSIAEIRAQIKTCPICNTSYNKNTMYCTRCGVPLP